MTGKIVSIYRVQHDDLIHVQLRNIYAIKLTTTSRLAVAIFKRVGEDDPDLLGNFEVRNSTSRHAGQRSPELFLKLEVCAL